MADTVNYLFFLNYLAAALFVIPTWRIMRRAGFRPAWTLLLFAPCIGYIATLMFLAYRPWPNRVDGWTPGIASVGKVFE